jgi:hypothetical protein
MGKMGFGITMGMLGIRGAWGASAMVNHRQVAMILRQTLPRCLNPLARDVAPAKSMVWL